MLTEKQKYFFLLGEVCEKLTPDAITKTIQAGYEAPLASLSNARIGRNVNLPFLTALVQHGLPDFEIPAHLRPGA